MNDACLCSKRCSDKQSRVKLRHDKWLEGQRPFVKQSFQFTKIGFPLNESDLGERNGLERTSNRRPALDMASSPYTDTPGACKLRLGKVGENRSGSTLLR